MSLPTARLPEHDADRGPAAGRDARIAVMGAGLIGRRHIDHVVREARLAAVVDPAPATRAIADALGAAWYPGLDDLLARERPDGVIVATPTPLHAEHGRACVAAGVPVLIEKPIADEPAAAAALVEAAEAAGVAILVGHHRRHNPLIHRAKAEIASGRIGTIVAVHATCWLSKPDDYFDTPWRREPGAGPVLTNLIHDIDLMRYLCGDIASVQAGLSNAVRGFSVEDTAAALIRFRNGALGTLSVSDTIAAPWSWELTAAENPAFPRTGQSCYLIGGTRGALSLPDLAVWEYQGARGWLEPISRRLLAWGNEDPLALQIRHFAEVALGLTAPLVSGREGLETLKAIAAIKQAARSGGSVDVG